MSITTTYVDGQVLKAVNVTEIITKINANETNINGLSTTKADKVTGKSLVSDTTIADLTDTTDTSLHYHSSDRNRSNHTGTQSPSTIIQDSSNRFVTDTEKSIWNGKATQTDINNSINNIKIGGRNLLLNSSVVKTGVNEFLQFADLAPIIDVYGLIQYTISFDIKSANVTNQSTMQVSMQNGAGAKYSFIETISSLTTQYVRKYITVTPGFDNGSLTQSILAFYGGYGTGNIPSVKNVKVELGNKATDWTPAPEDVDNSIALKADKTTNGTTATRPTATYIGQSHFDTTLGKPIWWNGTVWKDAIGTTV